MKAVTDAATLTGLVAGIDWIAKKVVKKTFTADPSSNVMKFTLYAQPSLYRRASFATWC